MTTSDEFCRDHYEHPLLWCDEKKRLVERKNAEESMRMWRRRKAEEVARKEKDKAEYYELFVKHYPWGRPGGGAPNLEIRRKDITAIGLHSTPTISTMHRLNSWQPCRYNDYFSQRKKCHDPATCYHHHLHHHIPPLPPPAPPPPPHVTTHTHTVRTTTDACHPGAGGVLTVCERSVGDVGVGAKVIGATNSNVTGGGSNAVGGIGVGLGATKNGETLHITLKDHPSMSFRNKGHLDIEVRYKPGAATGSKGKPLLEKIVVSDSDKCPLVQGVQTQSVLKCSPRKKKLVAKLEKPLSKDPWGKAGPGGKPWRSPKAAGSTFMKSLGWTNKEMLKDLDQDNPVTPAEKPTFRKVRTNKKVQRCCELCICTCPGIVTNKGCRGGVATMPALKKPHQSSSNKEQSRATAINPQITTTTAAIKQKHCPRFVRHCGGTLDTSNTNNTEQTSANTGGEGVELVPLLARRRANARPVSLSSTDVTKRTASKDRYACNMITRSKYLQHLQQLHCNNSNSYSNNININNMNNNNNSNNNDKISNSISKCKIKRNIANKICNLSNAISHMNNSNNINRNENSSSGTSCCLKKFTLHIR
ncbi:uncharacterized protein LOC105219048 isoform X1 [Zeugodacus cucurbitae]|uniref:uncharacterized protein LOC105219048 isoform X1 n=1 Tax=Zeugodacus cucurbitae TaxID=28588 RepID=UPI0023D8FEEB|nr:uncharacterized protein LOC105219048 isoform X1 [Zeugodacus cucurbitae]